MLLKLKSKLKDRDTNSESQKDYKQAVLNEYRKKLVTLEEKQLNYKYQDIKQ